MKKIFIASGYDSWNNKKQLKAFSSMAEADAFLENLTDPHVHVIAYRSTVGLVNALLKVNG